jgi:hypothetical protein
MKLSGLFVNVEEDPAEFPKHNIAIHMLPTFPF